MAEKIAVEGLIKEIAEQVCGMLKILEYEVCYCHETAYKKMPDFSPRLLEDPAKITKNIIASGPNLTILCNARGYLEVMKCYTESTDIPLLVLTGGGPDLVEEVKRFTPYVLAVPFRIADLVKRLENILAEE